MSVRARERAPLRRDAAAAQGERAARRRARDHQQRAGGARRRAQHPGHLRRGRRQDPRDLPQHGHGHPHLRSGDQTSIHYPYVYENGKRIDDRVRTARRAVDSPRIVLRTRETLVDQREHGAGDRRSTAASRCPGRRWRSPRSTCRWSPATRRAGVIDLDRHASASTRSAIPTCACCRRSPTA